MKKLTCLLWGLLLFSCSQAQQPDPLSRPEVERLVRTLASDEMQGRGMNSLGLERAAGFIEEEFRKAGLQPLPGEAGLRQPFALYEQRPERYSVRLNGRELPASACLALTGQAQISWGDSNRSAIRTVGPTDNLPQALREARQANQDLLLLVHPHHQETFARYRQHYTDHGNTFADPAAQPSLVLVLTEIANPKTLEVQVQSQVTRHELANVAGVIPGKRPQEIVLFSAHYDHLGIQRPVAGDSIANGADDNASGTSAVIALAHHYSRQPQPARTLVFVAFTAEEIGGLGSQHFSRQLNPDQIVAMFNIEMVGKPSKFGPNSAFITGYERSSFGPLLQQTLEGTPYAFHPDPYPEQNLFYRSDNATLARLGVPAHTISSSQIDQDKYYHTVDDEIETLDLEHLTNMVRAIANSAQDIVGGQATPTRVDKAQVE